MWTFQRQDFPWTELDTPMLIHFLSISAECGRFRIIFIPGSNLLCLHSSRFKRGFGKIPCAWGFITVLYDAVVSVRYDENRRESYYPEEHVIKRTYNICGSEWSFTFSVPNRSGETPALTLVFIVIF